MGFYASLGEGGLLGTCKPCDPCSDSAEVLHNWNPKSETVKKVLGSCPSIITAHLKLTSCGAQRILGFPA